MNKLLILASMMLITQCSSPAQDAAKADEIALNYIKQDYSEMANYDTKDSRVVNEKLYLERMIELKDGRLNAHYAKDLIIREIYTYERILQTKKTLFNEDLTEKDEQRFANLIKNLKGDLAIIEKNYPTDYGVFERLEKAR